MDPKALGNLDPKLKETYERVMGANPQSAAGAPSPAPTTSPTPAASTSPISSTPASEGGIPSVPSYTADNLKFQAAIQQTPAAQAAPLTGVIPPPQHKTPTLLKVLYIIGAIVLLIVYAYFWAKIFNLQLPF
ncbi:MAG TPA: hypothetical protein VF810_05225 [Patescibacteria group bacterium]